MARMGPGAAEPMKQTPMYQLYSRLAPKPDDWPVLLTKLGDLLRRDYFSSPLLASAATAFLDAKPVR